MTSELLESALTYGTTLVALMAVIFAISPRVGYAVFPRFVVFKNDTDRRIARIVTSSRERDGSYYYRSYYYIEFPEEDLEYFWGVDKLNAVKFSRAEWKSLQTSKRNEVRAEEVLDA